MRYSDSDLEKINAALRGEVRTFDPKLLREAARDLSKIAGPKKKPAETTDQTSWTWRDRKVGRRRLTLTG